MKIAIMGAGALGGYFGGRLAMAGEEVAFIARGPHLRTIRANGLKVSSPKGDFHLQPARATDDPAEIGPVDVVMFCVKLWDTDAAAEQIKPMIGPETAVVSFQNGVYAEDRLAEILGREHVLGGIAAIPASLPAPGVVSHNGALARLEFAELDDRASQRVAALRTACAAAGIEVAVPADIEAAIWRKFVFLSAFAAATCLCRTAFGPIAADEPAMALLAALVGETAAVARATGVAIADDLEAQLLGGAHGMPPGAKASMLQDLERGNRLELDYLSGAVVRLGAELGVDTPAHRVAWQALHPHMQGAGA